MWVGPSVSVTPVSQAACVCCVLRPVTSSSHDRRLAMTCAVGRLNTRNHTLQRPCAAASALHRESGPAHKTSVNPPTPPSHLHRPPPPPPNGQLLVPSLHCSIHPPPAPTSAGPLRQLHLRGKRRGSPLLRARAACAAHARGRLLRSCLLRRSAGRGLRCG
jgi:hypothetical protein